MMSDQVPIDVTVRKQGHVAILTMSGTENRINNSFCRKWMEALDEVESWSDVKALVTTGSGKFYSNGLDLNYLGSAPQTELVEFRQHFCELRKRILCFPLLTIAAINGHCFAAGLIMAFLHDYRVMHDGKGWMCLNEVDIRLRFSPSMRALFKTKFSARMIRDVALFGNRFTAKLALEIGLIDKVADEGQAVPAAVEMANSLSKNRTYGRQILHDMKSDLYSEVNLANDSFPGSIGAMLESKL